MTPRIGFEELLDLQVYAVSIESAAFVERELFEGDVVVGESGDFGGAGGGEVRLQLEDDEAGAGSMLELRLFGFERRLGVNARLTRGVHLLEIGTDDFDVVVNRDDDRLFQLLELQLRLVPQSPVRLAGIAGTGVAQGDGHSHARIANKRGPSRC